MKLIASIILGSILIACKTSNKDKYSNIQDGSKDIATAQQQEPPGKKLMVNNCYACHNPKTDEENIIAPPFVAVKMRYKAGGTSREEFIAAMVDWAKQPSAEKSRMPGAVEKFGVMPYQFFPEKTIEEIAAYIFENDIEEPEWFGAHYQKMHGNMKGNMGRGKGK